jgi:hypothetical protein
MAYIPINTGTAPNDGTGDKLRDAFEKINTGFESIFVDHIDKDTEFTVGTGKDFTTLDDALRYLSDTATVSSNSSITLTLDDGTHEMVLPSGESIAYDLTGLDLLIKSATGTKAACIITLPNASAYIGFMLYVTKGTLELELVTIDGTYNGGSGILVWPVYGRNGSTVVIHDVDFKNVRDAVTVMNNSYCAVSGSPATTNTFTSISNNAITCHYNSTVYIERPTTITNCGYGIISRWGSKVIQGDGVAFSITNTTTTALYARNHGIIVVDNAALTLTGNGTDYYIPVNEIQYDGSYITNQTGSLSFKT